MFKIKLAIVGPTKVNDFQNFIFYVILQILFYSSLAKQQYQIFCQMLETALEPTMSLLLVAGRF